MDLEMIIHYLIRNIIIYEVSFAIQTLQEQLTNVSKIHSHFLLDKYNFDLKTLEKSDLKLEYLPSAENDNFVATMIKNDQNKEMTFAFYPTHNTLSNEIIAWIVGYEKNNQSIEFILNALNQNLENKILDEVQKNSLIQEKLFRAEKLSAMSEMISNIAHQWRQPLCVISIEITGMKVEKEFGLLSDVKFNETCELINQNVQYLSKTIEDFNNFIKGTDTVEEFIIEKNIENFLNFISLDIKQQNISIILDIEKNISIKSYPNLLQQCFINIFNNSKDALIQTKNQERLFFISVKKESNKAII